MPVFIASPRHVTMMKLIFVFIFLPSLIFAESNVTGSPLWDNILARCSAGPTFSCVQNEFRSYLERSLQGDLNITDSIVFTKNKNSFSWTSKPKILKDTRFSNFIDSVENAENEVYEDKTDLSKSRGPRLNVFGLADLLYNKGIGYLMNHDLHLSLPSFIGGGTLSIAPKSLDQDGALVKLNYKEPEEEDDDSLKPTGRIFFIKRIKKFINRKLLTSFLAALLIIALLKIKFLFFFPLVLGVGAAKKILLKVLLFLFPALSHLFKLCAFYHHQHTKYHHHHHQVAHHHHHVPVPVISPSYNEVPEYLDHPPPGWHRMGDQTGNDLESWGIEHDDSYQPPYSTRRTYPVASKYQDSLNVSPNISPSIKVYDSSSKPKGVLTLGGIYDPFYSPILEKLDEVFSQLGFTEEGCRERLICSMYKAPERFSPHSNLVSAQLSRDAAELQKPGYSNPAVFRFYKYVQAARDGQDRKSCLVLYPSCSVITE